MFRINPARAVWVSVVVLACAVLLWVVTRSGTERESGISTFWEREIAPRTTQTIPRPVENSYKGEATSGGLKDAARVALAVRNFNVPIYFHGKVVDELGRPLSDAIVRYSIRYMSTGAVAGIDYRIESYELQTGGDGIFDVSEKLGDNLMIRDITKAGYTLASREQRAFPYAQTPTVFVPDRENPVIFTMIRAEEVEITRFTRRIKIPRDGMAIGIDPLTGVQPIREV